MGISRSWRGLALSSAIAELSGCPHGPYEAPGVYNGTAKQKFAPSWALPVNPRPPEPAPVIRGLQNRWLAAPLAGAVVATSLWYLPEPIQ